MGRYLWVSVMMGAIGCTSSIPDDGDGIGADADTDADADADTDADVDIGSEPCENVMPGDIRITSADDIAALADICEIGGDLDLDLDAFDFTGLENLQYVGGELTIINLPNITQFNGLSGLRSVGGEVSIIDNENLVNMDHLTALRSVGGLNIASNQDLTTLGGLSGVTSLGDGDLRLEENSSLTSLNGLSGITTVTNVFVSDTNFAELDGLSGITFVGGHLSILDNSALTNLDGLSGVTSVGGNLSILSNSLLCESLVDSYAATVTVGGQTHLVGNNPEC